MKTSNYNITLLHPYQAHKEQSLNLSIEVMDHIMNKAIKGRVTRLPSDAANGDIYLFQKHFPENIDTVQVRVNDSWHEFTPKTNMFFYDISENAFIMFNGTKWVTAFKTVGTPK